MPLYKVRIGRLEIECETPEALDQLIARYGGGEEAAGSGRPSSPSGGTNGGGVSAGTTPEQQRDYTLLKALVQAGESGVEAGIVSNLLGGAKGRSVPIAVKKWAVRVGLATNEENSVCVPARPGGQRGWRLGSGALGAAKLMLEGKG
jgi:hypothetical protein